eukprot:4693448-Amphidinium_carterae.1
MVWELSWCGGVHSTWSFCAVSRVPMWNAQQHRGQGAHVMPAAAAHSPVSRQCRFATAPAQTAALMTFTSFLCSGRPLFLATLPSSTRPASSTAHSQHK